MTRYMPHALGLGLLIGDCTRDFSCLAAAVCFVMVVISHVIAEFRVYTLTKQLAKAREVQIV